jgi:hypothetical protein
MTSHMRVVDRAAARSRSSSTAADIAFSANRPAGPCTASIATSRPRASSTGTADGVQLDLPLGAGLCPPLLPDPEFPVRTRSSISARK